ncbi:MAG: nucleoside kinase [Clostridiales bacterium]|nr:nucleoside kinase [Clostridiales bacterium]
MHIKIGENDYEYTDSVKIIDIVKEYFGSNYHRILAAAVNNRLVNLNQKINSDCSIDFIDHTSETGERIYARSLSFVLSKAVKDLYPKAILTVEHSLGNGLYCEINNIKLTEAIVKMLEARMTEIIDKDIPFISKKVSIDEAKQLFLEDRSLEKANIIGYTGKKSVEVYSLDGHIDCFYGPLVPSTGYLKLFKLKYYLPGLLILYPHRDNPEKIPPFKDLPKLAAVFKETENWGKILDIGYAASLNRYIEADQAKDLILISEALHEKKIAEIADMISENSEGTRLICIAGPSSSGKTSFSKRLSIQLRVNGLRPLPISLDNFYLPRELCPRDANGEYDFESIEALDLDLFNETMTSLIQGNEVRLPVFTFKSGTRKFTDPIKIDENQPIIIEGIHGLNEKLTSSIPKSMKFKIYISALTQINIDETNRIPTTYSRLIRRIVRDYQFRGTSALETLRMWGDVRKGEEKNIFPYQEEADVMFNSALLYEFSILKGYAEPLLRAVPDTEPEYSIAYILLELLSFFLPSYNESYIPHNSILREFIGGSCFDVY